MGRLTGKVAIVTGASKGIGAGIAKELAAEGAAVVVNYASSREGADRVVKEIEGKGGKAVAIQGDVSKSADVKRLFAEAKSAYGSLDVLVNNAGVYGFASIEEVTEKEYYRQFDTNVLGTLLATQEALKHFQSGGGSIINISSVVSTNPVASTVVYAATKGAVDTITIALSRELGARGIRVNAILPGGVLTEGSQGFFNGDFEKQIVASTPLGRLGQPADIAQVAVFLASDDSRWITGERIAVSGGFH